MSSHTDERDLRGLHAENERLRAENAALLDSQRATQEERDELVEIFDQGPVPTMTLDALGTIRTANHLAISFLLAIAADRRKELIGSRLKMHIVPEDQAVWAEHLRCCEDAEDSVACDVRLKPDILVRVLSRRLRPGARLYPSAIIDLRERVSAAHELKRLLEAEKLAREASQAKDDFIAILSHELRTPLTPVLAAMTAMQTRKDLPDDLRAKCEMVVRNILTESRLIDDLLDVNRIARRKMRIDIHPVDLHAAVRDVCETVAPQLAAKQQQLMSSLLAEQKTALGDVVRLKQVLWNLVQNAIKFTPAGGRIDIRSWNNLETAAPWIHIEVRDSGMGFESSAASSLFAAFEQGPEAPERHGGLGLGLAICKGIMELHDGRIAASSRGRSLGARFVVSMRCAAELGMAANAAPVRPEPRAGEQPTFASYRILLVEDNSDTRETLAELLEEAGHQMITAPSAMVALEVDLEKIDILISDIGLPEISGLELMRRIRGRSGRIPKALALSGYGSDADVAASTEAGFSAHLTKPIDFDSLERAIHSLSVTIG